MWNRYLSQLRGEVSGARSVHVRLFASGRFIGQHGVGQAIDTKDRGQEFKAISDPLPPVLVVVTRIFVDSTEKRLSDAALNRVHDLNFIRAMYSPRAYRAIVLLFT